MNSIYSSHCDIFFVCNVHANHSSMIMLSEEQFMGDSAIIKIIEPEPDHLLQVTIRRYDRHNSI